MLDLFHHCKMRVFILSVTFPYNVATVIYTIGRVWSRQLAFRRSFDEPEGRLSGYCTWDVPTGPRSTIPTITHTPHTLGFLFFFFIWQTFTLTFTATIQIYSTLEGVSPRAWLFVCCECYVLSGRGLCDELITRSEESYRLWCVVVCDLETSSRMRRPWPTWGLQRHKKNKEIVSTAHAPEQLLVTF